MNYILVIIALAATGVAVYRISTKAKVYDLTLWLAVAVVIVVLVIVEPGGIPFVTHVAHSIFAK